MLTEHSGIAYGVVCLAWTNDTVEIMSGTETRKIRAILEAAGVEFVLENGGGAGVRLRKSDLRSS